MPPEITQVERRAVKDSGYRVKASEVHLVDEPMVLLDLPYSREYFLSAFVKKKLKPKVVEDEE